LTLTQTVWDTTLAQLQLQMTRATFDNWLKDTSLLSCENGTWQVAVTTPAAQEWLQNRLHDTVRRVATTVAEHPVELQFIVQNSNGNDSGHSGNGHTAPATAVDPADLWQPDADSLYEQFTPPLRKLNTRTGYYPLPRFYLEFWEAYLTCRWKRADSRAFVLRQKLLSRDTRKIQSARFTPWTPVIETSFEQLADLINTNRAAIAGRRGQCQRYEQERDLGRPRGDDCCGRHTTAGCRIELATRGARQRHCYFWRVGVLEVLSLEKMVVVEQRGSNRYHQVKLQLYHQLPAALTPFQVTFLPERLQQRHRAWLMNYGEAMNWSLSDWDATPRELETFIDQDPSWYGPDRLLDGRYDPNPYQQREILS
jgi:hypothetical protein